MFGGTTKSTFVKVSLNFAAPSSWNLREKQLRVAIGLLAIKNTPQIPEMALAMRRTLRIPEILSILTICWGQQMKHYQDTEDIMIICAPSNS